MKITEPCSLKGTSRTDKFLTQHPQPGECEAIQESVRTLLSEEPLVSGRDHQNVLTKISSSDDSPFPGCSSYSAAPKKKGKIIKTQYQQACKQDWLHDEELKNLVIPDPKDKFCAICRVCDYNLKIC